MKTNYSSDEDDDDEEEDEPDETDKKDDDTEKAKVKKKTFKPIGDWRSNRHEREKFVLDKMKSTVNLARIKLLPTNFIVYNRQRC